MQNIEKVLKFQIEKNDKAVLYFNSENGKEISCMIDTGANVPIWFMGEDFLKKKYPSAVKTDKITVIHGLGENPLWDVPVWQIPEFILTDDEGETLLFHDLLLPVIEAEQFSFNMLLPLTMLNRTRFTFDYRSSAGYGYFTIEADKQDFYIHPVYVAGHENYLNRIQAFLQKEEVTY